MAEEKLVLSVLVDNVAGVLQRVASLFSRRGYNISSLTVSETEDPAFSRMTIETYTEPENVRQIKQQLLMVKVKAAGIEQKNALLSFNVRYAARVLDVSMTTITLLFTGTGDTIDMFISDLVKDFGIVELARTGVTSLARGEGSFTDDI